MTIREECEFFPVSRAQRKRLRALRRRGKQSTTQYRRINPVPANFISNWAPAPLNNVPVPRGSKNPLPPLQLAINEDELSDLDEYVDAEEEEEEVPMRPVSASDFPPSKRSLRALDRLGPHPDDETKEEEVPVSRGKQAAKAANEDKHTAAENALAVISYFLRTGASGVKYVAGAMRDAYYSPNNPYQLQFGDGEEKVEEEPAAPAAAPANSVSAVQLIPSEQANTVNVKDERRRAARNRLAAAERSQQAKAQAAAAAVRAAQSAADSAQRAADYWALAEGLYGRGEEEEEEAPAPAQPLRRSTRRNFGMPVNRTTYDHNWRQHDVMDVDPIT